MTEKTAGQGISRKQVHLLFFLTTVFFIAIVVVVAGVRIKAFEESLDDVKITQQKNGVNIKPSVYPTQEIQQNNNVTPEATKVPDPSAPAVSNNPTVQPTKAVAKQAYYYGVLEHYYAENNVKNGLGYNPATIKDYNDPSFSKNINLAPDCSISGINISHNNKYAVLVCDKYQKDEISNVTISSAIYMYDIKLSTITNITKLEPAPISASCQYGERQKVVNKFIDPQTIYWAKDDSFVLFTEINNELCSSNNGTIVKLNKINLNPITVSKVFDSQENGLKIQSYIDNFFTLDFKSVLVKVLDENKQIKIFKIDL